jgi:hypothetical protein
LALLDFDSAKHLHHGTIGLEWARNHLFCSDSSGVVPVDLVLCFAVDRDRDRGREWS